MNNSQPQNHERPTTTDHHREIEEANHYRYITFLRWGSGLIIISISAWYLVIPGVILLCDITDPHLRKPGVPRCAIRVHQALTPRYERWAKSRVVSGEAANLDIHNISGTEWPLFGTVFYLWATESLQAAWEKDHKLSGIAPTEYARGAIEACAALVVDPGHATWVMQHWGPDYLHRENVFYRMLLIGGLTSHYQLTHQNTYLPQLRDQVHTLARALNESPHGLLDDYPGECYPTDVLAAIACIRRADAVLGTDHSEFVRRGLRAFEGRLLDSTGLPPYAADSRLGRVYGSARGCGNSFMFTWAPELWPETARLWYKNYQSHFWQHRWGAVGFREFPQGVGGGDWYMDVDAGPVLAGHGFAAGAFGVGAARANGRFDHAYPLSTEMLALSWPLVNGILLGPRLLSDVTDAPYLGEAAILFTLTRQPIAGVEIQSGGTLPVFVYIVLLLYLGLGMSLTYVGLRRIGILRRRPRLRPVPRARLLLCLWITFCAIALASALLVNVLLGCILLLLVQILPRETRRTPDITGSQRLQHFSRDMSSDQIPGA